MTECTLNGQVIPCDQMPQWAFWLPFLMVPVLIAGLVFWIKMLLDVIKNGGKSKTGWIIVLCLTQLLGAFIYYFAVKNKRSKSK